MSELSVQRVWRDYKGSVTSETLTIGATEVDVENIVDFDENGGDYVLGADTGTYTGIIESDTDETSGTVTGMTPVTIAHPKGTFLYDGDHPRGPKRADGFLDGDDSLVEGVLIPAHLRRYFPSGKRLPEDMEVVDVAFDEDGSPYINDADFDEESAVEPVVFTWSATGNVSVGTKVHRFPVPFGGTIEEVKMVMGDGGAPTGASIIVDILKGGASILGTKITIASGDLGSDPIEPVTKEVQKGNIIQVEFEQVGSTLPGANPTLYMTMFPAEGAIAGRIEVEGPAGPAGAAGTNGSNGVLSEIQDEGVALTDAPTLDFVGAGVTATSDGTKYTVTIPGGSGSAGGAWYFFGGTSNDAGTAMATKGNIYTALIDFTITDLWADADFSIGANYRLRIYQLDTSNNQVGAVLGSSASFAGDGSTSKEATLTSSVALTAGTRYAIVAQRTTTGTLVARYTASLPSGFPLKPVALGRTSDPDPGNGHAWSTDTSAVYTQAFMGS